MENKLFFLHYFIKKDKVKIYTILACIFFLILPYLLFDGKYFIGGDDTRLFYLYPNEWLLNIGIYSWYHLSSYSISNPNQFIIPFLYIISLIYKVLYSKLIVSYLFFSLPLVLGLWGFMGLLNELFPNYKNRTEIFIGSLFYTISPILIVNQLSVFLYAVWIMALAPLLMYFMYKYILSGEKITLVYSLTIFLFFSIAFLSVPWILGFILPLIISLFLYSVLYKEYFRPIYFVRFIIYIGLLVLSQSYWFIPFFLNFAVIKHGSFSSGVLSQSLSNSFTSTVQSTALGNILYPLLNIFHREIAFEFKWQLVSIFKSFYDKYWWLNLTYVSLFIAGLFFYKKIKIVDRRKYLFFLFTFIISLFLFTVNIDILKNVFMLGGMIPGFGMFRNFYDKFAFGFVFFYSLFFTVSLIIINDKLKKFSSFINVVIFLIIIINIIPIKQIVNKPIWKTKDVYSVITIPNEYTNFMKDIRERIKTSSSILSLPYNIAAYSFIKDTNTNNVYAGTSPVLLLTGLNDFSGDLSFAGTDSAAFKNALLNKNNDQIQAVFQKYAINYIFITNNLSKEFLNSYLFEQKMLAVKNIDLLASINGKLIVSSSKGNYQLYRVKHLTPLISGKNVVFERISPTKFKITIKDLKGNESLIYRDTYNGDWKLFPDVASSVKNCNVVITYANYTTSECAKENNFTFEELQYLFRKPIPDTYHKPFNDFGNSWNIDYAYIKDHINSDMYTTNKDGSINISFTMYFVPQIYFYIGTAISLLTFLCLGGYVSWKVIMKKKK